MSTMHAQEFAKLTIDEGGVEGNEEADRGAKHLNGPYKVFFRQFLQRNIPFLVLERWHN